MKILAIVPFAIIFLLSCTQHPDNTAEPKFELSDTIRHMMLIDSVRSCNVDDELTLNGKVAFNQNHVVKVFPRSSGQVLQTPVTVGDYVRKGQVLAVVRSADVAGSYADLSSANADIAIAKRQMDNAQSLYKNGIASEREFVEAKQNYEKALATKHKVQSAININGGNKSSASGQYDIVAPLAGYLVEKKLSAGDYIRADASESLFTISDLQDVWVEANVYESDISKVNNGYDVRVKVPSYPDKVFFGKVDKVGEVLDPESKAMQVRVTLNNSEHLLKPEMFASIVVSNQEQHQATCIPTQALVSQDGHNYVVVANSNDSMSIAEVQILKTVGERTFVQTGVVPGQRVVTKEQLLIFNQLIEQ
ncbi:MAG: efflux RND transporter periplasmic adaptor subunit [Bacteroidetes bacterium]|nr:efflux RND transporter periplasmic adaptor subunit [Bacteroidota bacterium]